MTRIPILIGGLIFLVGCPASPDKAARPAADQPPEVAETGDDKPVTSPPDRASAETTERWQAVVELPMGRKIDLIVDFTIGGEGPPAAVLGVPAQGVEGVALRDVVHTPDKLGFLLHKDAMPDANETYALTRAPAGSGTATGTMTIRGGSFDVTMKRLEDGQAVVASVRRPQTPKTPYPYELRELTWTNAKDGTKRAGVVSLPKGAGPFAAVIIESGSGAHDRDGTFADHKTYLVIADHLTRKGIAVLRADDRGVGGSTGSNDEASYEDLADDMMAAIEALGALPEIDADRIGALGHSQGANIAALAAARGPKLAFVVMLCGMAVPGDMIMYTQKQMILESMGIKGADLEARMAGQRRLLDGILAGVDEAGARELVKASLEVDLSPQQRKLLTGKTRDQLIEAGTRQMTSPTMRSLVNSKPGATLRAIEQPVLGIFGSVDLQVEPKANEAALREHLSAGGNRRLETWIVADMSHNLQRTKTGKVEEYGKIEETVRPDVLGRIEAWVLATTTVAAP